MAAEPLHRIRETPPQLPPRFTVLDALRRELPIALLPLIVLLAVAVGLAYARTPVYTSEARLNVGGLNLTQQSIQGYTAAVQALSVAYARAVDATGVVKPVGRRLHLSTPDVVDRVSATPIQGSSVVRVIATGGDAKGTERLADAAADSLVAYAINLNSGRSTSSRLLIRYQKAARDYRSALTALAGRPGGAARQRLETQVDTSRLRRDTAGLLYTESQAGQAATELVQKLAPAGSAKSDRPKVLQDYLAAAAIGGILIGLGLAVLRANAVARRRLIQR